MTPPPKNNKICLGTHAHDRLLSLASSFLELQAIRIASVRTQSRTNATHDDWLTAIADGGSFRVCIDPTCGTEIYVGTTRDASLTKMAILSVAELLGRTVARLNLVKSAITQRPRQRYVLITLRCCGGGLEPIVVEWLHPIRGGIEAQLCVGNGVVSRFRPGFPNEIITAWSGHFESLIEISEIDQPFLSRKRSLERQKRDIGRFDPYSLRCSPDGRYLAFIRFENENEATVQVRSCGSLEVCWECRLPVNPSRCSPSAWLRFSKSCSHFLLVAGGDEAWVCPMD